MHRNQHERTDWRARLARARLRVRRNVPPGLRLVLGVLLIFGGILGFLPILGFWMIPLGVAIAAMDVRPMRRRWKRPPAKDDQSHTDV
ncbi:hypothetical protein SAMN05421688_0404 [Poseidonocella pacifica]|uniref:Transmembrane protein (PGPGW) n=1 Tax=Poseidonocella pacifica TaxID=871651 RepID=A0A1I0V8G8_9RHOB|nr:hypothetical protein SAMN05421688_0404 [Poseidonocella pacifica]